MNLKYGLTTELLIPRRLIQPLFYLDNFVESKLASILPPLLSAFVAARPSLLSFPQQRKRRLIFAPLAAALPPVPPPPGPTTFPHPAHYGYGSPP